MNQAPIQAYLPSLLGTIWLTRVPKPSLLPWSRGHVQRVEVGVRRAQQGDQAPTAAAGTPGRIWAELHALQ